MKGKLHKRFDKTWAILYTEQPPKSIFTEPIKQIPLHPDDAEYCMDIDDGNDIGFEIVKFGSKDDLIGKEYARILPLDEYEYPILEGTNRLCDDIMARRILDNSTYGLSALPLEVDLKSFTIDFDRVKTFEDVVCVLKGMQLHLTFDPNDVPPVFKEMYERGFLTPKN